MAIDLSTKDGRSSYFNDKLEDLMTGVDSTYGTIIFDELLKRIDKTISEFHGEMEEIFKELTLNEKKRQTVLRKLKSKRGQEEEIEAERKKKEWEQTLKDLYGRDNPKSGEEKVEENTEQKEEEKK